ncbi:MAG: NACHT domain-containing protein [Pyrinomonadaceae bacterium]
MRLRPLFALACLAFVFSTGGAAYAQAPPAGTETLRAVEQRARKQAQEGRPRDTVEDLKALYEDRALAEGVSLEQVDNAYQVAYEAARPRKSFWEEYWPQLGWVTALVLFFLALFRDTLRDVLGPRLKALGDKLYDRVAGYPVFWWKARGNYRKSLVGLYKRFRIPFMADRHLDMDQIYVPLKVEGASDIEQIVDFGEVARYRRLVVTGQPGSGKSMLLRRLALLHATGGLKKLPDQPTPVLFELHRLNKDDRGVFEHLVEIFRLHKFPEAGSFIKRSLARGRLMLLFDGLDEVDSGRRAAEVKKLKDFIQEHDRCRVMITCRTAVYRGEFDELADRRLEIVDFSDAQIEKFLKAWPDMPPNKSVGQLLAALDERPLIKALARRPLLLTIIAFLYTEVEDFRLPHSRADFYKRAAELLLGGLKGELNKYEAVEKQFVLEHLALYNQTKQAKNEDDRLTLDRQTVLGEIRKVLPELSRKEEDAPSMLEEIVERSSLLLPLDNKSRYVFSHLTLQEYFAASALRTDHAKLLAHFAADRDAWRETAKLWCGLAQDSTNFVNALFNLDPVTALECLADAKRLAPETADAIIDYFKARLGADDSSTDAVTKAFAAAATGNSPRNRRVFDFLVRLLHDPADSHRRRAAVAALSLTNNPEAAVQLAEVIGEVPEAGSALVRMGDLAVPHIKTKVRSLMSLPFTLAKRPLTISAKALASVGTPKAVEALVKLLWLRSHPHGTLLALVLGSKRQLPQVEAAVRALRLPLEYKQAEWYRWVWSPFEEGESTMAVVAGRIAYLIDNLTDFDTGGYTLDPRIVIPLVVHESQRSRISSDEWQKSLIMFAPAFSHNRVREALMQLPLAQPLYKALELLLLLDASYRSNLLFRLTRPNQPTLEHWRNIFRPVEFTFKGSRSYRAIRLVLFALFPLSVAGFFRSYSSDYPYSSVAVLLLIVWAYPTLILLVRDSEPDSPFPESVLFTPLKLLRVGRRRLPGLDFGDTYEFALALAVGSILPLNVYLCSLLFSRSRSLPVTWIIVLWVVLLGPLYVLYWLGKRKERRAGNPLVGLLDDPDSQRAGRMNRKGTKSKAANFEGGWY